jgi:hypothetical protein
MTAPPETMAQGASATPPTEIALTLARPETSEGVVDAPDVDGQQRTVPVLVSAQAPARPTPTATAVCRGVHALSMHAWSLGQIEHVPAAGPHADAVVPGMHVVPWQQPPPHEKASQTHMPETQRCPVPGQGLFMQIPPHPSLAPHAAAEQLGVQPQMPA